MRETLKTLGIDNFLLLIINIVYIFLEKKYSKIFLIEKKVLYLHH